MVYKPAAEVNQDKVQLPTRAFLYTLDQIAFILSMSELALKNGYIFYSGVTTGPSRKHLIQARDISVPLSKHRDWRVAETELIRWMKLKGFKFKVHQRIIV